MGKDKDHHFHLTVLIPQAGLLRAWPTMLPSQTMKGYKREGEREAPLKRKTNEAKYLASVSGVSSLTLWGREDLKMGGGWLRLGREGAICTPCVLWLCYLMMFLGFCL